ncbi:MAG TPA: hypothetical protein VMJ32_11530 [Pirellulales bacterium]|nr:hypothetical protein [Pirellulales bacterium]
MLPETVAYSFNGLNKSRLKGAVHGPLAHSKSLGREILQKTTVSEPADICSPNDLAHVSHTTSVGWKAHGSLQRLNRQLHPVPGFGLINDECGAEAILERADQRLITHRRPSANRTTPIPMVIPLNSFAFCTISYDEGLAIRGTFSYGLLLTLR